MEIAAERWGQLRGNLIPVASETEMVDILRNETEHNSAGVCSSFGLAGGTYSNSPFFVVEIFWTALAVQNFVTRILINNEQFSVRIFK